MVICEVGTPSIVTNMNISLYSAVIAYKLPITDAVSGELSLVSAGESINYCSFFLMSFAYGNAAFSSLVVFMVLFCVCLSLSIIACFF